MFDSFFRIGSSHKICEDYTIHNTTKAVLCDGCSGAVNTDFGARILAHSALSRKDHIWSMFDNATDIIYDMDLPPKSLCCTLGIIDKDEHHLYIRLFGDGCIAIKTKDSFNIFKVTYPIAPYYPIYDYFVSKTAYIEEFGLPIVTVESLTGSYQAEIIQKYQPSFHTSLPLSDIEYVLLFSDGILSFQKDYRDIINELVQFKGFQGEFLRRRLTYLFKHEWSSLVHSDDFSCVAYTDLT